MATTQAELDLAFQEVGTQFKLDRTAMGLLASLATTSKTSLVAAINEIAASLGSSGAVINDTTPGNTTVYSSTKTEASIAASRASLKTELLGGVDSAYDTLQELVTYFNGLDTSNDADVSALVTALGNRVRFDAAQTLTAPQKAQANANIGSLSLVDFGDPAHSYKNVFTASLA